MSGRGLTDAELRAAAARRPGYATYPEYRPGRPERLGRLPRVAAGPLPPMPARSYPVDAVALPVELDADPAGTLAELPPSRIFEFQPEHAEARPWWRRRWMWAVMPATGRTAWGYCWTGGGARRRTARAARRAAR